MWKLLQLNSDKHRQEILETTLHHPSNGKNNSFLFWNSNLCHCIFIHALSTPQITFTTLLALYLNGWFFWELVELPPRSYKKLRLLQDFSCPLGNASLKSNALSRWKSGVVLGIQCELSQEAWAERGEGRRKDFSFVTRGEKLLSPGRFWKPYPM